MKKYKTLSDDSLINEDLENFSNTLEEPHSIYKDSRLSEYNEVFPSYTFAHDFEANKTIEDLDLEQTSEEDEVKPIKNFLRDKGFISEESWSSTIMIGGKIMEVDENFVYVECLINKENKIFEIRKFSKQLFEDCLFSEIGNLILIRIRTKTGSQRIDILDAKGMGAVTKEDFDFIGDWEGIDKSLTKPLPKKW